jgi:hypothetical protein
MIGGFLFPSMLAAAIAVIAYTASAGADEIVPASLFDGEMPPCNSEMAKAAAISSFHNDAHGIAAEIADLVDITPQTEAHFGKVACNARAILDDGNPPVKVSYWFTPLAPLKPGDGGRVMVGTIVQDW